MRTVCLLREVALPLFARLLRRDALVVDTVGGVGKVEDVPEDAILIACHLPALKPARPLLVALNRSIICTGSSQK